MYNVKQIISILILWLLTIYIAQLIKYRKKLRKFNNVKIFKNKWTWLVLFLYILIFLIIKNLPTVKSNKHYTTDYNEYKGIMPLHPGDVHNLRTLLKKPMTKNAKKEIEKAIGKLEPPPYVYAP